MDEVFRALADASRRGLLDSLNSRNGQTLRELCAGLDMARQSVSKHLAILERPAWSPPCWRGREKLHYLNAAPINDIADRWINRYDRHRVQTLSDLKQALEDTAMSKPEFVYTTYISTTPERLWQALTDPAFTRRYWDSAFDTDWQPGSAMTWDNQGVQISRPGAGGAGRDPYRRLSYTWHTFTPELATAIHLDEETFRQAAAEARSKVTFEIEPAGQQVKLTVVHDGFEPGSVVMKLVSHRLAAGALRAQDAAGERRAAARLSHGRPAGAATRPPGPVP